MENGPPACMYSLVCHTPSLHAAAIGGDAHHFLCSQLHKSVSPPDSGCNVGSVHTLAQTSDKHAGHVYIVQQKNPAGHKHTACMGTNPGGEPEPPLLL